VYITSISPSCFKFLLLSSSHHPFSIYEQTKWSERREKKRRILIRERKSRHLDKVNIGKGLDGLGLLGDGQEVTGAGQAVDSLQVLSGGAVVADCLLDLLILDASGQDLLLARGGLQVGHGDVELLSDDSAVDLLVYHDTDGSLVDVEHHAGSAVVVLEGHALVDRRVDLDVDIVTSLCSSWLVWLLGLN
jgi:hypothetical protein